MLNPSKTKAEIVRESIATIASGAKKLFITSQDPEVRGKMAEAAIVDAHNKKAEEDEKAGIRLFTKNTATLNRLMSTEEQQSLFQANGAHTMSQKGYVIAAELRQRGVPVLGETPFAAPQTQKSAPAAASAVAPAARQMTLPVVPATVAALAPAVASNIADNAPLVTTAQAFMRMSDEERKMFGRHQGQITKAQFDMLSPADKSAYFKHGGKLDMPVAKRQRAIPETPEEARARSTMPRPFAQNGTTKTYADFSALSAQQKMEFCRNGGRITD